MKLPTNPSSHDWIRFSQRTRPDYATRALAWAVVLTVALVLAQQTIYALITHYTGYKI